MDLVKAARQGRESAFFELFDEHHRPLFRFAYRLTGSAADAEDIVQDCFLALLRPGCTYDSKRTPLLTYLFGAVRNQSLKRRRKPDVEFPPATPHHTPESEFLRTEFERTIADAVGELPDTQREIVILAHYEQMPLAQIAEVMNLDLGAVKSRLQRARAGLKETLAGLNQPRTELKK